MAYMPTPIGAVVCKHRRLHCAQPQRLQATTPTTIGTHATEMSTVLVASHCSATFAYKIEGGL